MHRARYSTLNDVGRRGYQHAIHCAASQAIILEEGLAVQEHAKEIVFVEESIDYIIVA